MSNGLFCILLITLFIHPSVIQTIFFPSQDRIAHDRNALLSKSDDNDFVTPEFFDGVAKVVEQAQEQIERSVNVAMCVTYYEVGRLIEQSGASRAGYGRKLLSQ